MFKVNLKKEEISLRPMEARDLEFFVKLRNECAEFLHDNRKFSFSEAKKWFPKTPLRYYVIEAQDERVGYLRTSEWDLINKNMYIGGDIHPKHRRKGYATKAYQAFMDYLFKEEKFNKVSLEVLDFNKKAIALYEKLGFKVEGIRRHHVKRGNRYYDSIIMAVLKSNYGKEKK